MFLCLSVSSSSSTSRGQASVIEEEKKTFWEILQTAGRKCAHTVSKVTVKCQLWYVVAAWGCTNNPLLLKSHNNCGLIWTKSNMSIVSQGEEEASMTQLINGIYFFPPAYGKDNKLSPITWEGSACPLWLCMCARGFDTQGGGFQLFGEGKCWTLLINPRVV